MPKIREALAAYADVVQGVHLQVRTIIYRTECASYWLGQKGRWGVGLGVGLGAGGLAGQLAAF